MKSSHIISMIPAAALALTLLAPVQAGVINEAFISKGKFFKQSSATTVKLLPAAFVSETQVKVNVVAP
jgi:hypothetical protein